MLPFVQISRNAGGPGDRQALGGAIIRQRTRLGLSTAELARTVGVSHQRLQDIENGCEDTSCKLLRRIADTLEVTPHGLMLCAQALGANTTGVRGATGFAQLRALGHTIRAIRTEQGLKTSELAATLDISHTCLTDLEEGRYDPTYDLLLDLADALELPVGELAQRATTQP